jgi:hypothetical protein
VARVIPEGDRPPQAPNETDQQYAGRLRVMRALERLQRERREGEGWLDQMCRMLGVSEEFATGLVTAAVVANRGERNRDYAIQDAYGTGIELGLAFAREADDVSGAPDHEPGAGSDGP